MRRTLFLLALIATPLLAQDNPSNQPVEPFRIIGNIYYVGANEVTSFLITTPKGHILLDGGFKETAPMILANIARLGFKPSDVRILLNSHAHLDHAGGLAELKRVTGAKLLASAGDLPLLARGGADDPQFGETLLYPPVEPDSIIRDGGHVVLDGTTLVAHITAGHTRGCTTYTMRVRDGSAMRDVVFFCSPSVPTGYKLVDNRKYPDIVDDYRREFATLEGLKCDVPLGSHGSFFSLSEKRERLATQTPPDPFVDPQGCRSFIATFKERFEQALAKQTR